MGLQRESPEGTRCGGRTMPVESHMPRREPLWLMRTSSLSSIDRFLLATVEVSLRVRDNNVSLRGASERACRGKGWASVTYLMVSPHSMVKLPRSFRLSVAFCTCGRTCVVVQQRVAQRGLL